MSKISPEDIFTLYDDYIGIDFEYVPPDKFSDEIRHSIDNGIQISQKAVTDYNRSIILKTILNPVNTNIPNNKKRALQVGKTLQYYQKNKTDTSFVELVTDLCGNLGLLGPVSAHK